MTDTASFPDPILSYSSLEQRQADLFDLFDPWDQLASGPDFPARAKVTAELLVDLAADDSVPAQPAWREAAFSLAVRIGAEKNDSDHEVRSVGMAAYGDPAAYAQWAAGRLEAKLEEATGRRASGEVKTTDRWQHSVNAIRAQIDRSCAVSSKFHPDSTVFVFANSKGNTYTIFPDHDLYPALVVLAPMLVAP
jgi:hypothetical protein